MRGRGGGYRAHTGLRISARDLRPQCRTQLEGRSASGNCTTREERPDRALIALGAGLREGVAEGRERVEQRGAAIHPELQVPRPDFGVALQPVYSPSNSVASRGYPSTSVLDGPRLNALAMCWALRR